MSVTPRPAGSPGGPDGEDRRPRSARGPADPGTGGERTSRRRDGATAEGKDTAAARGDEGAEGEEEERQAKAPWHFKFIVVGSVVYLGWRLYQGISWLAHHI